jgi:hypothetical protein
LVRAATKPCQLASPTTHHLSSSSIAYINMLLTFHHSSPMCLTNWEHKSCSG